MKKYKVFDITTDSHEYDIIIDNEYMDGIKYCLYYSNNKIWTYPGEICLYIIDNGCGFTMSLSCNGTIDYSNFVELSILSSFIRKHDGNLCGKYSIIDIEDCKEL
jgi:hypothetical protein